MRWLVVSGGLLGALGVIGATLYAHARPIPALGQAAYMALFHAPVLLWLSRETPSLLLTWLSAAFLGGNLIFVGTIYLRYLGGVESATKIAPVGGSLVIIAWLGLVGWGLWGK
ncbi:MAG: DUF423 domain-containing protein [Bacteroidia bacterium]|nr:DUF423 domain-containing protein [Bacteroidia bacterium]MDW8236629.1 DUF423 domain-containing protein [Bacteroidia bacterium]